MDTVVGGDSAGEHRGMCRECHRYGGHYIFKEDALASEGVDIRCGFMLVAITAEIICPAGVDAYKKDVADILRTVTCVV